MPAITMPTAKAKFSNLDMIDSLTSKPLWPDLEQEPCQASGMADFRGFPPKAADGARRGPCPLPDRIPAGADESEQRWHGY
jgi:hypothetical protein